MGHKCADYSGFIGTTVGSYTIISAAPREDLSDGYSRHRWNCRCICGRKSTLRHTYLMYAKPKCRACGMRGYRKRVEGIPERWMVRLRNNAAKRKLDFTVTEREQWGLFNKQKQCCALSGCALTMPDNAYDIKANKATASLDRIDSALGYVSGNVQWVHKEINQMK